jgi:hypothetical protein
LSRLERYKEATHHAERAVGLEPAPTCSASWTIPLLLCNATKRPARC